MTDSQRLLALNTAVGHVYHAQECLELSQPEDAKAAVERAIRALERCRDSMPKGEPA